jgi:hypothetical protein
MEKGFGKGLVRTCSGCNKEIKSDDVWYPFFDISSCGGGILYYHARCAVDRVLSMIRDDKKGLLQRATEAEKERNEPLSDGLMNFYWAFPISPVHWAKFYALEDDEKEIVKLFEKNRKQTKDKSIKRDVT